MEWNIFRRMSRFPSNPHCNSRENQFTEALATVLEACPGLAEHWLRSVLTSPGDTAVLAAMAVTAAVRIETQHAEGGKFVDLVLQGLRDDGRTAWSVWIEVKVDAQLTWSLDPQVARGESPSYRCQIDNYLVLLSKHTEPWALVLAARSPQTRVPEGVRFTTWSQASAEFEAFLDSWDAPDPLGGALLRQFVDWMREGRIAMDRTLRDHEREIARLPGLLTLRRKLIEAVEEAWKAYCAESTEAGRLCKDAEFEIRWSEKWRDRLTVQVEFDNRGHKVVFGFDPAAPTPVACCWVVADHHGREPVGPDLASRIADLAGMSHWVVGPRQEHPTAKAAWWLASCESPITDLLEPGTADHVGALSLWLIDRLRELRSMGILP